MTDATWKHPMPQSADRIASLELEIDALRTQRDGLLKALEGRDTDHSHLCRRCFHRYTPEGSNENCPKCGHDGTGDGSSQEVDAEPTAPSTRELAVLQARKGMTLSGGADLVHVPDGHPPALTEALQLLREADWWIPADQSRASLLKERMAAFIRKYGKDIPA
jgi:hypothetical protein